MTSPAEDDDSVDLFDLDAEIDEYKESEDHRKERRELEKRAKTALPCDKEAVDEDGNKLCSIYEVRVAKAKLWKDEANSLFKNGEYNRALGKYMGSLIFLRGIDDFLDEEQVTPDLRKKIEEGCYPTSEEQAQMRAVKVDVYNNMGLCLIKSEFDWRNGEPQWAKVIKYSDEVLSLDRHNVKALFKKGRALYHLGDTEEALKLLEKAIVNSKGYKVDPQILHYQALTKKAMAERDKDLGKLFKGVFDKMANAPDHAESTPQEEGARGKVRKTPKWVV